MYKVFCDNSRLCLFFDAEQVMPQDAKSLRVNTIAKCVELIQSWLEQADKADLDLFAKDFSILENALNQVFDWRYAAGGAVLVNNKLLSILRNGIPDLPKGHIDDGESAEQAAIREVCEETGLTNPQIVSSLPRTLHCYKLNSVWVLKQTAWYFMRSKVVFVPAPQLDEGITEIPLLSEKDFDTFFSTTYRAINEELASAIKLQYKAMQTKK